MRYVVSCPTRSDTPSQGHLSSYFPNFSQALLARGQHWLTPFFDTTRTATTTVRTARMTRFPATRILHLEVLLGREPCEYWAPCNLGEEVGGWSSLRLRSCDVW